ncbi:MAG: type 1 glutamine amidotransferase [Sphingomonadaceae bacterium]|nr:type 1 glutamine amidotransferase [Sphingomonadaceae bacterium]
MPKQIDQAKILIIATDGYEYSELTGPRDILEERGATVHVASPDSDPITGESGGKTQGTVTPDMVLSQAKAEDYDALLLPGGQVNPDSLRINDEAIALINAFAEQDKPIAAICHAPWLLIEAELVDGRRVTSWPSLRTDLRNAGGTVVDEEAVVDGNIVTARNPDDIPAFTDAFIGLIEKATAAQPA